MEIQPKSVCPRYTFIPAKLAHLVLMPHATKPYLDRFLEDLEKNKA